MEDTIPRMRFLCFGAGAIGTYIGGSLALAGQEVVFFDRPETAEFVRKNGLTLHLGDDVRRIQNLDFCTSIDEALTHGPFDVGILAVKSYDTAGVIEMLKDYSMALPPILSFQNGVENEAALIRGLGQGKVIAGTLTSAIGKLQMGEVVVEKLRGIGVASDHLLASGLVKVLDAAGLRAQLFPDAASMKWSKMLTNLPANATSAILNMTASEIYRNRDLCKLEIRMLREALAVMHALRLNVVDLPGTPTRLLAFGAAKLPLFLAQPFMIQGIGKGRGNKMPSFHIDFHSGSGKSEVDYLNGAVLRIGKSVGVDAPVNRVLTETLLLLTAGELNADEFDHRPEKLLERF
ncbi:MAG: 2-dehydropantoate 2-reductase [Chloroflexi bacterium]|nr:2-dehydropantoate 2-reductase [Chloroflexota bacterium]